jgi:hypothetical protein
LGSRGFAIRAALHLLLAFGPQAGGADGLHRITSARIEFRAR